MNCSLVFCFHAQGEINLPAFIMLLEKILKNSLCIQSTLNWRDQSLYGIKAVWNLYADNVLPINSVSQLSIL